MTGERIATTAHDRTILGTGARVGRLVVLGLGVSVALVVGVSYLRSSSDLKHPIGLGLWVGAELLAFAAMLGALMWQTARGRMNRYLELATAATIVFGSGVWWLLDAGGAFEPLVSRLSTGWVAVCALVALGIGLFSRGSSSSTCEEPVEALER